MTTLRLEFWDIGSARQKMTELEYPKANLAGWVGSVSTEDKTLFLDFMSKARKGDVEGLAKFQHMGGDLVYAVLLKLDNDQWKLVVILSPSDLYSSEEAVFTAIFCLVNVSIEIYHRQVTKAEQQLLQDCRPRNRDILKHWIKQWFRI